MILTHCACRCVFVARGAVGVLAVITARTVLHRHGYPTDFVSNSEPNNALRPIRCGCRGQRAEGRWWVL